MKSSRRSTTVLALALALGAGACLDQESADPITAPALGIVDSQRSLSRAFRVYTQNMFLGGETDPLFTLPFGDLADPDPVVRQQALGRIIAATGAFHQEVQRSDIPARTAEIADEIQRRRPHVVALQEAVGYATGVLSQTFDFTPTAPGPDLLASVMGEITTRGLPYHVAVMRPTTSIALPMGPPDAQGLFPALGVQDRVVMLVHDDLEGYDVASGVYQARIPLGPAEILRGWARVTIERGGTPMHFVSTHLETQGAGADDPVRQIHNGQADQLQNTILAGLEGDIVLMGDLNSDAEADPSERSWTPTYGTLVDAGYIDVWEEGLGHPRDEGFTCCLEEGRALDERIDFVLLRPDDSAPAGHDNARGDGEPEEARGKAFQGRAVDYLLRATTVGDRRTDQTASGLWPSDHAGIVARIARPIRPLRQRPWR